MSEHLDDVIRATLAEDGARYPVSVGALHQLEDRLTGTTGQRPRRVPPARKVRRRIGVAGGALVALAAAIVVLVAVASPTGRRPGPPVSLGTGAAPTAAATSAPPASVNNARTLALRFTADRLLLGGADVYAFGADSAGHPWAARLHDELVVRQVRLPAQVCSASLDGTGVIAVVEQSGPDCLGRGGRGTLGLLDPVSLSLRAPSAPARGGDALVRPEGTYVVDAGVISLVDAATLAPTGVNARLGSGTSVVNLAGDPGQDVIFATVLDAGHPTRLYSLRRDTLQLIHRGVDLAADAGALPYATAGGAVWLSLAQSDDLPSEAELLSSAGLVRAFAFEGSPLAANYAESGTRLWALDSDGTLRCADLTTGNLAGASKAPAPGVIAADTHAVYVAEAAHRLDILTPAAACGG